MLNNLPLDMSKGFDLSVLDAPVPSAYMDKETGEMIPRLSFDTKTQLFEIVITARPKLKPGRLKRGKSEEITVTLEADNGMPLNPGDQVEFQDLTVSVSDRTDAKGRRYVGQQFNAKAVWPAGMMTGSADDSLAAAA
jgi:hypothetical protein